MLPRRILSLVIALLATVAGLGLLWTGGITAYQTVERFGVLNGPAVGGIVMAILGSLLLGIAAASVVLSSLGVIVVGAVHLIGSMLTVLVPFDLTSGVRPPTFGVLYALNSINRILSDGALTFTATGLGLALGASLIGVGVGAHFRSRAVALSGDSRTLWRVLIAVVGGVVGLGLFVGIIGTGFEVYRNEFILARSVLPLGVLLVVLALLLGAVLASARWSSLAAIVVGAFLTLFGLIGAFVPAGVYRTLPHTMVLPLIGVAATFFLFALGLSILGLGVGSALRARRVTSDTELRRGMLRHP